MKKLYTRRARSSAQDAEQANRSFDKRMATSGKVKMVAATSDSNGYIGFRALKYSDGEVDREASGLS